jgi:hypothetical protein
LKRIVLISLLAMFVFTGCFLIDEFAESTVRIVNESEYDITFMDLDTGQAGRVMGYNVLKSEEVLEPGDDLILGLAPILHEYSSAEVTVIAPDDDSETSDWYSVAFTYKEGAEVILTFTADSKQPFSIEDGVQREMYK